MKRGQAEKCEGCSIQFATHEHRVRIDGIEWHESCVLSQYRDRPNAVVTLRRISRQGAHLTRTKSGGVARVIELTGFAP